MSELTDYDRVVRNLKWCAFVTLLLALVALFYSISLDPSLYSTSISTAEKIHRASGLFLGAAGMCCGVYCVEVFIRD